MIVKTQGKVETVSRISSDLIDRHRGRAPIRFATWPGSKTAWRTSAAWLG